MGKLALFLGGFLLLTILIGILGTIPPSWVHCFFPCAARPLQATGPIHRQMAGNLFDCTAGSAV